MAAETETQTEMSPAAAVAVETTVPLHPPAPLLCLGMARTGTASLAAALEILGVEKVHHGLKSSIDDLRHEWAVIDRAADATFPVLPTYTGKPFTREQWDEIFGPYDAVTDVASFFAVSLINAYPEAPVILVERDVDKWFASISIIFENMSKPSYQRLIRLVESLTGNTSGRASIKMETGWTEARRPQEIILNAKTAYARHYREVREAVPKEQLLDFQLKDGWEPLCRFLGKEIPDVPFPHVNDAAAYKEQTRLIGRREMKLAVKKILLPFKK